MTRDRSTHYGCAPMALTAGLAGVYGSFVLESWPLFFACAALTLVSLATWLILIEQRGRDRAAGWEMPAALVIGSFTYAALGAILAAATYDPHDIEFFEFSRTFWAIAGAIAGSLIGAALGLGCAVLFAVAHVREVIEARRSADIPETAVTELTVTV